MRLLVFGEVWENSLLSSRRVLYDAALSCCTSIFLTRNLPCGRASCHTVLCNTLILWDAIAGCASSSVHTPTCPASPPTRHSAKFRCKPPNRHPSPRLRRSACHLAFIYTDPRCSQARPLLVHVSSRRPLLGRHTSTRRPFARNRNLR